MTATTRMLLSHNCTLSEGQVFPLSRDDFAQVFIDGLKDHADIQCSLIENPHWIVEVLFNNQAPTDVAKLCAQTLAARRIAEPNKQIQRHTVMLLGGIKTTPAMGTSPTSLQPGEWGVDVVEAVAPDQFLAGLNWDTVTANKPSDQIFKVTHVAE